VTKAGTSFVIQATVNAQRDLSDIDVAVLPLPAVEDEITGRLREARTNRRRAPGSGRARRAAAALPPCGPCDRWSPTREQK
jgi:hypothetical protein